MATYQPRSKSSQDIWDKIWKDKYGKVVVWQNPNPFLIGWVVLVVVSIFTNGTFSNVLWYIALADLVVWSLLEIFKGVNYFRRALGVVVLLLIVAMLFKVGY